MNHRGLLVAERLLIAAGHSSPHRQLAPVIPVIAVKFASPSGLVCPFSTFAFWPYQPITAILYASSAGTIASVIQHESVYLRKKYRVTPAQQEQAAIKAPP